MSYTIEYNRQFIKSTIGITPVWLAGDNNVTTGSGRYEKRCRDWCVFHNLLATTEKAIIASVEPSLNGYQEHWRRNGKWVDDAALIRWIRSGCKNAASVEDIIEANRGRLRSIRCSLSVWSGGESYRHNQELSVAVCDTAQFDAWLANAMPRIDALRAAHCDVFPIVDFGVEDLKHPNAAGSCHNGNVVLCHGKSYLSEPPTDSGSSWNDDVRRAWVFTQEEARVLREQNKYGWIAEARFVSASVKESPFNAVIRVCGGDRDGMYVLSRGRSNIRLSHHIRNGKHYRDQKAAERVAGRMKAVLALHGATPEIVIDSDSNAAG